MKPDTFRNKNLWKSLRQGAASCMAAMLLWLSVVQPAAAAGAENLAPPVRALSKAQEARQVLSRLTFGARPADVERVQKIGVPRFIDEQLSPETIDDSALDKRLEKLTTLSLSTPALAEQYNPPKPTPTPMPSPSASPAEMTADMKNKTSPVPDVQAGPKPSPGVTPAPKPTPAPKNPGQVVTELQRAKLLRAVYSERQLYEMTVDFWENHFNIYANKDADRWLLTAFDRDSIRPFAMGRFRDLLGAVAHSPAMLFYLDNWQSSVVKNYPAANGKPARKTGGINENYARELMELHTLGVGGGYTQQDVQEVARCFTGWTIRKPNEEGIFVFNPAMHDNGEKTVLGQKILPGGGTADAERVLDILAKQPATANFIAAKLARRFLGENPPRAAVERAAKVFSESDGSIRETLRALITSQAFLSLAAYQNKVKTPFEFAASSLRILGAETDANRPVLDWISKMGEPVFGHVSPDGYPEKNDDWLSVGSLLTRFNFAVALAGNKIKGTTVDSAKLLPATDLKDDSAVSAALIRLLFGNDISSHTKEGLAKFSAANLPQTGAPNAAADEKNRSAYVAGLVTVMLAAPEFQRR
jgi:uncharacterized protein (DUF1800 family)